MHAQPDALGGAEDYQLARHAPALEERQRVIRIQTVVGSLGRSTRAACERRAPGRLAHQRVQYVNDGFRSILHETTQQEFLEREFGFERAYTDLQLSYREPYRTLVRTTFPMRNMVSRFDQRLRALYELERLSRATRRDARSPS